MRYQQFCALARAAEFLGERWTLLIVRELLLGPKRFSDLRSGLEGISSSVLAKRLAALEKAKLISRTELEPPAASTVYALTESGRALRPAVYGLIRWGGRFLFPPRRGERFDPRWLLLALSACARKDATPPHTIEIRIPAGKREFAIHVVGGPGGTTVEERTAPAEVTILVSDAPTVLGLMAGKIDPAEALQKGQVRIEGNSQLISLIPQFFVASAGRSDLRLPGGA